MYNIVRALTFVLCLLIIAVIFLLVRKISIKHRNPDFNEKFTTDKAFRRKVIIRSIFTYIVFIADENNLKLYSVARVGDKFSVVDFQCENCSYYEPKSINSIIKQPTNAKFNKATGETFYYIRINPLSYGIYENVILDIQKMQLATVDESFNFYTEVYEEAPVYYYIDSNPPKENFKFDTIDYSTTFKLS